MNMRQQHPEQGRGGVVGPELARAEQDYQRLRSAYFALAQAEPANEVALAMVGADMDRAHAVSQLLVGQQQLPLTKDVRPAVRLASRRMAEIDS